MRRLVLVLLVAALLGACDGRGGAPKLPMTGEVPPRAQLVAAVRSGYHPIHYVLAAGVKADRDHQRAYRFDKVNSGDARRVADFFGETGKRHHDHGLWSFGENLGERDDRPFHNVYVGSNGSFSLASGAAKQTPTESSLVPAHLSVREAKLFALTKLKEISVDLPDPVVTTSRAQGSLFRVRVTGRIDGHTIEGFESSVTIDQNKRIAAMSGALTTPKVVGTYELVSLKEAIDRLTFSENSPAPLETAARQPAEPKIVQLTAVRVGLMLSYDTARWLTPAYVFTTDAGEQLTIPAAADRYFSTVR